MKELKGRLFEAPPEEIRIPSERIRKEFAEKDMEKLWILFGGMDRKLLGSVGSMKMEFLSSWLEREDSGLVV